MVARYLASFLLTSALIFYNPQVFQNRDVAGNVEVYQSIESGNGENVHVGRPLQVEGVLGSKECKWSSECGRPLESCEDICRYSSNMKPPGSWIPSVPIQADDRDCMRQFTLKCKCCRKKKSGNRNGGY